MKKKCISPINIQQIKVLSSCLCVETGRITHINLLSWISWQSLYHSLHVGWNILNRSRHLESSDNLFSNTIQIERCVLSHPYISELWITSYDYKQPIVIIKNILWTRTRTRTRTQKHKRKQKLCECPVDSTWMRIWNVKLWKTIWSISKSNHEYHGGKGHGGATHRISYITIPDSKTITMKNVQEVEYQPSFIFLGKIFHQVEQEDLDILKRDQQELNRSFN